MPKVVIYTTPTCPYCKMAMKFFEQNSIVYEEKNVATDIPAREEMLQKSHQFGVPVIDIDGKIIIGFNRPELSRLLGLG